MTSPQLVLRNIDFLLLLFRARVRADRLSGGGKNPSAGFTAAIKVTSSSPLLTGSRGDRGSGLAGESDWSVLVSESRYWTGKGAS
jgi:hypothetical protein